MAPRERPLYHQAVNELDGLHLNSQQTCSEAVTRAQTATEQVQAEQKRIASSRGRREGACQAV